MGTSSSKFRKHLQNGEEYAAMQLYQGNPEFRRSVDPNLSYGESHQHNTPLHLVAQHSMKSMLRSVSCSQMHSDDVDAQVSFMLSEA